MDIQSKLNDLNLGGLQPAIDAYDEIEAFADRIDRGKPPLNEPEQTLLLCRTLLNAALIVAWSNRWETP